LYYLTSLLTRSVAAQQRCSDAFQGFYLTSLLVRSSVTVMTFKVLKLTALSFENTTIHHRWHAV
jgi:hypothetical protein